jgi:hypothetical protein
MEETDHEETKAQMEHKETLDLKDLKDLKDIV